MSIYLRRLLRRIIRITVGVAHTLSRTQGPVRILAISICLGLCLLNPIIISAPILIHTQTPILPLPLPPLQALWEATVPCPGLYLDLLILIIYILHRFRHRLGP